MQTIRIPNSVHLSPAAQGLYDTAARILLASQGKPGRLRGKLRASCTGQFTPAWNEMRRYLKIVRIPVAENSCEYYFELRHEADDSIPYVRTLTMKEGRKYLNSKTRIRGYREPEIGGKEKYTHIPVAMLSDHKATLAMRGLLHAAWQSAALSKNTQKPISKETIRKASRCKEGRINAAWKLAKELGYIYQERILDEKTGRISWVYRLLESADVEYCAAARPTVNRKAAAYHEGNTVVHADPVKAVPRIARGKEEREALTALIRDNLHYTTLIADASQAPLYYRPADVDGYIKLMVDTICTTKDTVAIGGDQLPADTVRAQLLRLTYDHLIYVMRCVEDAPSIRNPRSYKLTALYRAADTLELDYKVG